MLTKDQAADIFAKLKKYSTADEVEAIFFGGTATSWPSMVRRTRPSPLLMVKTPLNRLAASPEAHGRTAVDLKVRG